MIKTFDSKFVCDSRDDNRNERIIILYILQMYLCYNFIIKNGAHKFQTRFNLSTTSKAKRCRSFEPARRYSRPTIYNARKFFSRETLAPRGGFSRGGKFSHGA